MLDSSTPPSWLRPLSLRWIDLADEYPGAAARRLAIADGPCPQTPEWRQAWSDVIHSRRTLEALQDAGVTAVCLHHDDGFGHVAQADDIRINARFATACRDLGLRVFARIEAGALFYETLLRDRPGLAAWAQRDARGDIVYAGEGLPAWRPCYRSRGFLELLRDSVSLACEQLRADGVVLANFGPHDCHCERCQQAFRRMLAQRHPEPRKTLGLPSLDHVRLPLTPSLADPLGASSVSTPHHVGARFTTPGPASTPHHVGARFTTPGPASTPHHVGARFTTPGPASTPHHVGARFTTPGPASTPHHVGARFIAPNHVGAPFMAPQSRPPVDPLHCEAAHFSVLTLRTALAELRIHLRSISAHLALWAEPRLGDTSASCAAFWEVCAPLDIVTWTDRLGGPSTATLAARCLAGNATRTFVHTPSRSEEGLATSLGAAMAFGGHVLANDEALRCHDPSSDTPAEPLTPRFIADPARRDAWAHLLDFAARHEHYHHRAESLAEVALAFSVADIAAGPDEWAQTQQAQSALLGAGIPFDIVPIQAVRRERHRLVVIAGQARVTDEEAGAICSLAQQGVPMALVGDAGACDPYGRRRALGAFSALAGLPHVRVVLGAPAPLPAVVAAARDLLPHPPVVELAGPPAAQGRVFVCPFRLPTGQAAIHLLNATEGTVEGLRLHVRADLAPSRHVALHQPGATDTLLDCTVDGPSVATALPPLLSYALVITS